MKRHEEFERLLASYRDAAPQERAAVEAHLKVCPQCAARLAAYERVDAALGGMPQVALPASLTRPLSALVAGANRQTKASSSSVRASGFIFRGLAPAGAVLFLVVAVSLVLWSVNSVQPAVTSTPTLTMTLTPTTTLTSETQVVGFRQVPTGLATESEPGPTPAPIPAPVADPPAVAGGAQSSVLLAGSAAHATITN